MEQGDLLLGERENMVFMGMSVTAGTSQAIVVAKAIDIELNRTAGLIEETDARRAHRCNGHSTRSGASSSRRRWHRGAVRARAAARDQALGVVHDR